MGLLPQRGDGPQWILPVNCASSACATLVYSYGVLHHTQAPERGIAEHFRITRPGGKFWLYLYGAGGLYWHVYDRFRPVVIALDVEENHRILRELRVREGLIYTFLDNLRAPRVYYLLDEVLAFLRREGEFEHQLARGISVIDDTQMLLATKAGFTWRQSDYQKWLIDAGFTSIEFLQTPSPATVVIAK